jgi:signal transduction histidine kinase
MLHDFLALHRDELIARCQSRAAIRFVPGGSHDGVLPNDIPRILDHVIEALHAERVTGIRHGGRTCGGSGWRKRGPPTDQAASRHGLELLRNGFPVEEVVYGYSDLCEAVTDLAVERHATIENHEFRALNDYLDMAIADALVGYSVRSGHSVRELREHVGILAHELRSHLQAAILALAAIKAGNAGAAGADGAMTAVLDRSLTGMCSLVERSLADVRATSELPVHRQTIALADFIADVRLSASLEADARECVLTVEPVDPSFRICADRDLLFSALGNLLHNAFKFTRCHTEVRLKVHAVRDRVLLEVEDHCGGLPAGDPERMFRPFTQIGRDRSGCGLGLSICRGNVEACGGVLGVRNVPGKGCIFTIYLPLQIPAKRSTPRQPPLSRCR